MHSDASKDDEAIESLTLGLELGMNLIDTAEMYGAGHSEEIVARVLGNWKNEVLVASKVSPSQFDYDSVLKSAGRSLERLAIDHIDLYQLHWPNPRVPIRETMRAMEKLVREGKIRHIGISNFSVGQMKEAQEALSHNEIVSNQVEYSLLDRSIEADILPYCQKQGITVIAYSPLGKGRIPKGEGGSFQVLDDVAAVHLKSRSQVALAWLLGHESVVAIPKAIDKAHVRENAGIIGWRLSRKEDERIGAAFSESEE